MKKSMLFIASLIALAGCKVVAPDVISPSETSLITKSVKFGGEWTDPSKTLINDEGNLVYAGTEEMAVGVTASLVTPNIQQIVKATTAGQMDYTFTHSAIEGAQAYDYFFVMPYRDNAHINLNGAKSAMYVKLDSLQHPTATSFDPLQDYMIASPLKNVSEQISVISHEDLKFKRIVAATCLTIKDSENKLDGQPILKATLKFPLTENSDKKNNLINIVYLRQSENYAEAGSNGWADVTTTHVSPSVAAVYTDGLAKTEDGYKVWLATLPVVKAAGVEMTVIVETAKKKIVRKVTLPSKMTFSAEKINALSFNITGEGYKEEELLDQNDYWSIYNAGEDIVAGGLTINKTNYPDAKLLSGTVTQANLQQGGVLFLDADFESANHYMVGANTVLIGRYKDSQPVITMGAGRAIYLEKKNIILKNLKIVSGTTSNQTFVSTNAIIEDSDYAVIEDCNILAYKNVMRFNDTAPAYAIKNFTIDNCVIKMAGTDANYAVISMAKAADTTPAGDGYGKMENMTVNNCVIYADAAYASSARRHIVDAGSSGNNYKFPTNNLNVNVTRNTLYNINASSNILVRTYVMNSAKFMNNVLYADLKNLDFKATYVFGLYAALEGDHSYKVRENYASVSRTEGVTTQAWTWKYSSAGPSDTYSVGDNAAPSADAVPFLSTMDVTKGYFPVDATKVTVKNGAGASYDTKYWISK